MGREPGAPRSGRRGRPPRVLELARRDFAPRRARARRTPHVHPRAPRGPVPPCFSTPQGRPCFSPLQVYLSKNVNGMSDVKTYEKIFANIKRAHNKSPRSEHCCSVAERCSSNRAQHTTNWDRQSDNLGAFLWSRANLRFKVCNLAACARLPTENAYVTWLAVSDLVASPGSPLASRAI